MLLYMKEISRQFFSATFCIKRSVLELQLTATSKVKADKRFSYFDLVCIN